MTFFQRGYQSITSAFLLVLMATLWFEFAPIQAGGQTAYIVIVGNSMEPNFHIGDLAIVQHDSTYNIGDIVAYKNAEISSNVFHRIIGINNNHYTLKGDNNSWVDTYQPSTEEVIGKLWIHLPKAGNLLQKIRKPVNMALIAGTLAGIFIISFFFNKPRGSNHMNKKSFREWSNGQIKKYDFREQTPVLLGSFSEIIFFILGLIAFGSLILGIISFTRPLTISSPDDVNYQHIGVFSYSATAPSGIYDSNTVQTGEPIFPNLTCSTQVNFHYSLIGDSLQEIAGTYQVTAQIVEPQTGWQRTVNLQSDTPFSGSSFDANANLNLCEIIKLTEAMEQETDFHPGQYSLLVTPKVTISGKIAGRKLEDKYSQQLAFRYDRLNFSIIKDDPEVDPFASSQPSFLREIRKKPNTIQLFGMKLLIWQLQLIALAGFGASLAGIWMLTASLQRAARKHPESYVQMKYSSMIIDIQSGGFLESSRVADVQSIEDLARLADRSNTIILHEIRNREHLYYINVDGVSYRFMTTTNADLLSSKPPTR